ncbi:MAG TPA: hypothetical protein ENH10_06350 [Bacteroidetes bacterium]|nr:hypothetical protein BMS3Bbin04_01758 [bacterium BMS3Bbin04]HDO65638.1 hypothetical protein [Bacteroidota bacterium]HEX04763.1 hypothetical protein [Bacteroidota bacterium]
MGLYLRYQTVLPDLTSKSGQTLDDSSESLKLAMVIQMNSPEIIPLGFIIIESISRQINRCLFHQDRRNFRAAIISTNPNPTPVAMYPRFPMNCSMSRPPASGSLLAQLNYGASLTQFQQDYFPLIAILGDPSTSDYCCRECIVLTRNPATKRVRFMLANRSIINAISINNNYLAQIKR